MLSIFTWTFWTFLCLLWINVYLSLLIVFFFFFNWEACFSILSFMSNLYILEISPLSVASFATIFSQSIGKTPLLNYTIFLPYWFVSLLCP